MNSKVTYHQQVSYCGKPRCRRCREGIGHGPYWYAYQTVDGRTTRTYIGKQLPPEKQAELDGQREPLSAQAREREQSTLRIYTLGQFRIERRTGRNSSDWQTVTDATWQHQRVRALLACLVSNPGRKLAREQIIDALWPDLDYENASGRLDRAVYNLRQLFEPGRNRPASKDPRKGDSHEKDPHKGDPREKDPHKGGLYTSSLLLTEREMITLAEHPQIWIDADVFEQLLSQAHATSDPGEKEKLLDEAMMLYSGDFLPEAEGNRLEWARTRRESLKRNWVGMLLDLADLRAARESYLNAIEPLDRLLSVDFTNEAAVQRLMSLLAQLGRRGEALRTYKRLVSVLQQEYRIAPLPETRSLYEAIRRGSEKGYSSLLSSPQADSGRTAETPAVVQIGRAHQSPLVGREQEINALRDLITTVENNSRFKLAVQKRMFAASLDPQRRPQSVFLFGEVGIGKTRLAEEASREAKRRGWAVAWSRVYAQEGGIPYRLWTEILRKAMAQGAWQRQELSNRALVFQPLNTLMPDLHIPGVSFSVPVSPEQEQLRLWEAVYELLAVISTGTPLLIALDDLQWADGSSCELLAYIARRLHGYPIVIIGTCRENELTKDHPLRSLMPDLQREMALETIPLQLLSDDQIDAIVANVPDLPRTLAERIRDQAAGNPFFAEELARTFGVQPSGKELPTDLSKEVPINLPETITAVLDLRLGRLSQPCQLLLRKAAVLSSAFTFDLITAMEAGTPGSSEDLVLELLEEALKSGMLTEEGTGTRITYHFWHPLLADHLYEGLSAARRASLHRRAATLLIEQYKGREAEGAAVITHHLEQGGADPQLIAHYAELAANRSYTLSAYPDAEKLYRIVLQYRPSNAALLEPDGTFSEEGQRYTAILERLGECTRVQGRHKETRQFYEQALALHKQQHIDKASLEYQYEVQYRALLLCEIGYAWYDEGKNAQAWQCYQQAEDMLRGAGISEGPAWAYIYFRQSYVNWRKGEYGEAHKRAYKASNMFEKIAEQQNKHIDRIFGGDQFTTHIYRILAGDPVNQGRTRLLLGLIANGAGNSAEALTHLQEALNLYEQCGSLRDIAIASCNLCDVYMRKGDYRASQAFARRSLSITEKIGDLPLSCVVFYNLGVLAVRLGDPSEAEKWYQRSISASDQINNPVYMSSCRTGLVNLLHEQGRFEEARAHLHRALTIGRSINIEPCIGLAMVSLGSLRISQFLATRYDNGQDSKEDKLILLTKAVNALKHALELGSMEAETKIEGHLALAQAMFLADKLEVAQEIAIQSLNEAQQADSIWLIALAQRVLGNILAARNQREEATHYIEQASRTFRKVGMRPEYGRTLFSLGEILLRQENDKNRQQGAAYLQEARKIFKECKSPLDLQRVDHALAHLDDVVEV